MIVRRYLPDGSFEDWPVSELTCTDLWLICQIKLSFRLIFIELVSLKSILLTLYILYSVLENLSLLFIILKEKPVSKSYLIYF